MGGPAVGRACQRAGRVGERTSGRVDERAVSGRAGGREGGQRAGWRIDRWSEGGDDFPGWWVDGPSRKLRSKNYRTALAKIVNVAYVEFENVIEKIECNRKATFERCHSILNHQITNFIIFKLNIVCCIHTHTYTHIHTHTYMYACTHARIHIIQ